jgi:hypothetical protein
MASFTPKLSVTKNVADNESSVKAEAIKKGCCPQHPDVILKTGWGIFKKTKECPRCKADYEYEMEKKRLELEALKLANKSVSEGNDRKKQAEDTELQNEKDKEQKKILEDEKNAEHRKWAEERKKLDEERKKFEEEKRKSEEKERLALEQKILEEERERLAKEEDMKKPAKGTYTFDDGSVYTGDLLNGKPNGLGEIKYAENNERGRISYVGEVKEGKPDGKGKMTLTYWRMYDGDFKDGMFLLLAGTEYMAIDV